MKAPTESITDDQLENLKYPVLCSPKIDGIRAVVKGGVVLSNSLKPIPNQHIQALLKDMEGCDGELVVGLPYKAHPEDEVFNRTTGAVRRVDGKPNFTFWVFDDLRSPEKPYKDREFGLTFDVINTGAPVEVVGVWYCSSPEEVKIYAAQMLSKGYEGIMIRDPYAPYRYGRCTTKEGYIFKYKPFDDVEAVIVGFEEQMENHNEKVVSELGTSKRSSHKANKTLKGTLGKFILKADKWPDTFKCGTGVGLTAKLRKEIWEDREGYLGKVVTIKYQKYGSLDKPRIPIFKGFRDCYDISPPETP